VAVVFRTDGLTSAELKPGGDTLRKRPKPWGDFMMRFEPELEGPDPPGALASAVTIGLAYVGGGFTPFGPYPVLKATMAQALPASVGNYTACAGDRWIRKDTSLASGAGETAPATSTGR
jgi:vacuolar iron transporter family protein